MHSVNQRQMVPNEQRMAKAFRSGEKERVYGTPLENLAVAIDEVSRPGVAEVTFDCD